MISPKGILIGILVIALFGSLIFNLLGASLKCGLSGGKNCESLTKTVGESVVFADLRIDQAVDALNAHKDGVTPIPSESLVNYYRLQILFGLANLFVFIFMPFWFLRKIMPESQHTGMVQGFLILIIVLLIGLVQFIYSGQFYSGVLKLIGNTDVLFGLVDSTGILPGEEGISQFTFNQTTPSTTPIQAQNQSLSASTGVGY